MTDDPADEAPAGPPSPARRIRRDVVIGAAALIAAAFVGKALSHGSDAPASRATPPSSPSIARALPSGPVALPPLATSDAAACPEPATCLTQEAGNGLALLPVRSRLPKAELVRFRTVLL